MEKSDRGGESRENKRQTDRDMGTDRPDREVTLSHTFTVRDIQDTLIANFIPYIDFYLSPN